MCQDSNHPRGSSVHLSDWASENESLTKGRSRSCCGWKLGVALCFCLGSVLLLGSVVFGVLYPIEIDNQLNDATKVCNNASSGYAKWLTNDPTNELGVRGPFTPRYRKFYGWNLTNPDEYLRGNKAVLEEMGPYSYRQYTTKFDVAFTETTQRYRKWNQLVFDPEQSCEGCSPDDKMTNLNPVYLGAMAKLKGSDTNLVLAAGVPYYTSSALAGESCFVDQPQYAKPTFLQYSTKNCVGLNLTSAQEKPVDQGLCCVYSNATKASGILTAISSFFDNGDAEALLDAEHIFGDCGLDIAILQSKFIPVVECMLGFWGVSKPSVNIVPAAGNLFEQTLADKTPRGFGAAVIVADGVVTTKSIDQWYKGGPSLLAQILTADPSTKWPGYALMHHDTLQEAMDDPTNMDDEAYSGCAGSEDNITNLIISDGKRSYNHSYWSDDEILVNVDGGQGIQMVPQGVSGFGGAPSAEKQYLWVSQLKRPAAIHNMGQITFDGVKANNFSMLNSELDPYPPIDADLPGLHVSKAALGVGQVTCKRNAACLNMFQEDAIGGLIDFTPLEGFASYLSRPYYAGATDPRVLDAAILKVRHRSDTSTYLVVEPASGRTILAHERLQLSSAAVFKSDVFFPNMSSSRGAILAQWWVDVTAEASGDDLDLIKDIIALHTGSKWALYIGPALGVLICGVALYYLLTTDNSCCTSGVHTPEVVEEEDERRSSLIHSAHSKSSDFESRRSSWHDRCDQMRDAARSFGERYSTVGSSSSSSSSPGSRDVIQPDESVV